MTTLVKTARRCLRTPAPQCHLASVRVLLVDLEGSCRRHDSWADTTAARDLAAVKNKMLLVAVAKAQIAALDDTPTADRWK